MFAGRFVAFFLLLAINSVVADLLKTVYCKDQCSDYLKTADNLMPLCSENDLPPNECGTVISCFWSKSEFDSSRPQASESNVTCCYKISIKEKGDCEAHDMQIAGGSEVRLEPAKKPDATPTVICQNTAMPWMIASFLLCIVAIQSAYIMWVCVYRPSSKISQGGSGSLSSQFRAPAFIARPLVDTRLLRESCDA